MLIALVSDKTHKKQKFGGSGEIDTKDIAIVESTYKTIVKSINHLLKFDNGKFNEVSDLLQLKEQAEDTLWLVKTLKDLCDL
jgi:hypothetical protein